MTSPPKLAERLLRWSLPDEDRDAVLGDLHEEFGRLSEKGMAAYAQWWYWHQTIRSLGPNLARRVRRDVAHARRLETGEDRQARLKGRTWGGVLLILGTLMLVSAGDFDSVPAGAASILFIWLGCSLFFGSFLARGPRDPFARAISARRLNLFWLCYLVSNAPHLLFGQTHLVASVEHVSRLIGLSILLWPQKYWMFGSAFVPRAPQIRTPFVGPYRTHEGSLALTIDAPDAPVSVSDLIVVRDTGRRIIGINRVFSNADSLRVYAAIGEGSAETRASIDVLDSSERVVRSAPAMLTRAELVNLGIPARRPKVPLAQVDAVIDLHALQPGDYQIRVLATDETRRAERCGEFRITDQ